jgi:hypothetical protein
MYSLREMTGLDADGILKIAAFQNSGESRPLVEVKFATPLR